MSGCTKNKSGIWGFRRNGAHKWSIVRAVETDVKRRLYTVTQVCALCGEEVTDEGVAETNAIFTYMNRNGNYRVNKTYGDRDDDFLDDSNLVDDIVMAAVVLDALTPDEPVENPEPNVYNPPAEKAWSEPVYEAPVSSPEPSYSSSDSGDSGGGSDD